MLRRGPGIIDDEHGAAMAEYVPLLAIIALLVMFAVAFVGPWASDQVIDASVALDDSACPPGWKLTWNTTSKKNGQVVDKNNDNMACVKYLPGDGDGNTGNIKNIKDNFRGPTP
jgi:Flp pilus assembly pilin Flp